ncbi:unnamed protein product [Linum trigynum]|uniref:Uncharacterized protein n=1 Tax=Linum trigynum TaxID=586398 RepID=A0AAV2GCM9_9ROSI
MQHCHWGRCEKQGRRKEESQETLFGPSSFHSRCLTTPLPVPQSPTYAAAPFSLNRRRWRARSSVPLSPPPASALVLPSQVADSSSPTVDQNRCQKI